MEKFLIYTHIFCGATVLLLGIVQMFNRKGGRYHILIGRVYVIAMYCICASALLIISFYRFSAFLMVIAVLTFYFSFVGVRVLKRKTIGSEKWVDWTVAVLTMLFGVGLVGYAIHLFLNYSNRAILGFLCTLFGLFTFLSAYKDIRFLSRSKQTLKSGG